MAYHFVRDSDCILRPTEAPPAAYYSPCGKIFQPKRRGIFAARRLAEAKKIRLDAGFFEDGWRLRDPPPYLISFRVLSSTFEQVRNRSERSGLKRYTNNNCSQGNSKNL
jgi:hypothetical protein